MCIAITTLRLKDISPRMDQRTIVRALSWPKASGLEILSTGLNLPGVGLAGVLGHWGKDVVRAVTLWLLESIQPGGWGIRHQLPLRV